MSAPWTDDAACATTDPDMFFSDHWQDQAKAKDICSLCPVREICRDEAMANNEQWGVWGMLSRNDRIRLGKQTA